MKRMVHGTGRRDRPVEEGEAVADAEPSEPAAEAKPAEPKPVEPKPTEPKASDDLKPLDPKPAAKKPELLDPPAEPKAPGAG